MRRWVGTQGGERSYSSEVRIATYADVPVMVNSRRLIVEHPPMVLWPSSQQGLRSQRRLGCGYVEGCWIVPTFCRTKPAIGNRSETDVGKSCGQIPLDCCVRPTGQNCILLVLGVQGVEVLRGMGEFASFWTAWEGSCHQICFCYRYSLSFS